MQVNPYLSFNGQCEAAFKLYERCLGAKVGDIFRYGGSPMSGQVPPDWQDKIMHATLTFDDQIVMAGDVLDFYEAPKGFSLSVHMKDPAEAERVFAALADGGTIKTPLEKTFWAERFGMFVDRFGISWMINCGG